ncbi:hypothetical protein HYX11_05480 [Candidatus Woesearchaeota archaeon]|nr:hypothetical protein [Candidatus Woesearchaeota archaeon]
MNYKHILGLLLLVCVETDSAYLLHKSASMMSGVQVLHISLEQARRDVNKRQQYLEELLQDTILPYCDGVEYDHDGDKIKAYQNGQLVQSNNYFQLNVLAREKKEEKTKGGKYHAYTPSVLNRRGRGEHTKIFAGQSLFSGDICTTDDDILVILAIHEYRHVLQYARGMPEDAIVGSSLSERVVQGEIDLHVVNQAAELDAYKYTVQFIESNNKKVSQQFHVLMKNLERYVYHKMEEQLSISNPIQRHYIEAVLQRNAIK